MQQPRPQPRAPGSFTPLSIPGNSSGNVHTTSSPTVRPQIRRIESSSSDDTVSFTRPRGADANYSNPQSPVGIGVAVTSPSFPNLGQHPNSSTHSLQSFSRPTRPNNELTGSRTASPLTLPPTRAGGHSRKHSNSQGHFEPTLPSTTTSNLSSHVGMAQQSPSLSASQIAAQAAMLHQQHNRHRSQTVPFPGAEGHDPTKRPGPRPINGPRSPPMLSLTEASAPRDSGFANQSYYNGLLGSQAAATAAANVVFPRTSPQSSPALSTPEQAMPPPLIIPDKPPKPDKPKVKLFSRPKKIDTKSETKERPVPSPSKIGSALASLQRGNFSTTSLGDPQSLYSLGNASASTIRPIDTPVERENKEKKHHFLSRQKHKLTATKDDYHLPLSSASSNSKPVDPTAPSVLYNFNLPPSPGPANNLEKSVSGLDLRHGGRALRERRKEEKMGAVMRHDNDSSFGLGPDWLGSGNASNTTTPYLVEQADPSKHGPNSLSLDDAWPFLQSKLLIIFEGEDLRIPIEDFNRIVTMHIQYCFRRRSAHIIVDDLRDLLQIGFTSLDHTLRKTPEDRLIPALVELWIFTFTSVLPYMQAVFLPLDLEISGSGSILSPDEARDFWGGVVASHGSTPDTPQVTPASEVLNVRRLVLIAYRDVVILPRYEKLKTIFSRLSLEHLPSSLASLALASPPPIPVNEGLASLSTSPSAVDRPGTAMSLDPSVASYNSNSTTVFGNDSNPSRSRAISNVSYGSGVSDPASAGPGGLLRPFTPQTRDGSGNGMGSNSVLRDQNVEDSKQVTEMVGRMLQCMSVLASVGAVGVGDGSVSAVANSNNLTPGGLGGFAGADESSKMVSELGRLLKLNWLGRGRTGRNRRGIVGGRVRRQAPAAAAAADRSSNSVLGSILREGVREGVSVGG